MSRVWRLDGRETAIASPVQQTLGVGIGVSRAETLSEAWNKRATIFYLLGEYQLSMKDCDEVLKRNSSHFGALSGYGQMHLNLGDFDRAIAYFERALKVNPDLPFAAATMQLPQQQQQDKQRSTI